MDAGMTAVLEALAPVVAVIFGGAVSLLLWPFIASLPLRVAKWADPARFDPGSRAGGESR